jgi:anti-sigma factor RsiW
VPRPASGDGGARRRAGGGDGERHAAPEDITCKEIVEIVSDYVEGLLGPDEREAVELHLNLCDGCADYLEQLRVAIAVTGELPADALSPEVEEELCLAFRSFGRA